MTDRKQIRLRFGHQGMVVSVPAGAAVLEGQKHVPAIDDAADAIRRSLAHPIGCPPLGQLLRRRRPRAVAITISDITRPVPNKVVLPALLDEVNAAGISDEQVAIIIATGMHRSSTHQERDILVGPEILGRCEVIDHKADDAADLVRVSDDPPVLVNRRFYEAEFRIVTGLIEPHLMAGYSGGRKGVCPALVDLNTVQRFHGHAILADPRSTTGVLDGNPCHAESMRVAKIVGMDFLVNVAINHERQLAGVYCGDMEQAHLAGVGDVQRWTSALVSEPFDLVITNGGGFPLDQTFYQSVKGLVGALPALHEQSTILMVADCGEGVGSPEFAGIMRRWHQDWRGFLDHIAGTDQVVKDQWQYQVHARVLEKIGVEQVWLVSDGLAPQVQPELAVTPILGQGDAATRCQQAIDHYLADHPTARVAVVPAGPYVQLFPARELARQAS